MDIESSEKYLLTALNHFTDVIEKKTAELDAIDVRDLVKEKKSNKTEFSSLSEESQKAARAVLAELLKQKYQSGFDLPDDTANYLGHRVRKAFITLESDKKDPVICNSESFPGLIPD